MVGVHQHYRRMLRAGRLQKDDAQRNVLQHLSALERALAPAPIWRRWRRAPPPRSLYIHGPVGGGKSMLMDLFYTHCAVEKKRRVHFHAFMQHVHARRAELRKQKSGKRRSAQPLLQFVDELRAEVQLLCFDEFHVSNIADAGLLHRLVQRMLERKMVLVATSNDAPRDLYQGGLQRERFVPFIALVEEAFDVCALEARHDYRRAAADGAAGESSGDFSGHWFVTRDASARTHFEACVRRLCAPHQPQPGSLSGQGRAVFFDQLVPGVARISYDKLCGLPLGARDYLVLAHHLHSLVLDDVPPLGGKERDACWRFITLLDILYDHRIRLVASSSESLERVWQPMLDAPRTVPRQKQAILRARSRLEQMSRPDWGRRKADGKEA